MDTDFLSKVQNCTAFNLKAKDFETVLRKEEIRHLFITKWFPKIKNIKTIFSTSTVITEKIVLKALNILKSDERQFLVDYQPKGIGPGEILMYFIFDKATVGGGGSEGVDIIIGSNKYEMKAINPSSKNELYGNGQWLSNFRLGGTVPLSDIMSTLKKLSGKKGSEVNQGDYAKIKKDSPEAWEKVFNTYRDIAYNKYFKGHQFIFIQDGKKKNAGEPYHIGEISKEMIYMGNMTSGTIKPMIKLN